MNKDVAIKVSNVSKSFKIPHERQSSLKGAVLNFFKKKGYTEFHASKNISFEVKKGEFLGIIGRNGCGKSTMLKMLAGIYFPDAGNIEINGKLSPFLELGVGFNEELTARDNVYLNGTILGLTRKEIDARFDDIIAFAELEEFVDQKLKNFSSGMQVRLAFSVAIQAQAEILLIDEVLAVGDANFQAKSSRVFHKLKKEGRTIVFVTHDMNAVKEYCDRVILLKDGEIYKEGNPKDVTLEYDRLNFENGNESADKITWGNLKAIVEEISYSVSESKSGRIEISQHSEFKINFKCKNKEETLVECNLSAEIFKIDGVKVFGSTTNGEKKKTIKLMPNEEKVITLDIANNNLTPGEYYIDYRLYGEDFEDILNASAYASRFKVNGTSENTGVVDLGYKWQK